jgi:uncharacterized protein (TIGR00251 family)
VKLRLRVQPGAKRTALLTRMPGGDWKVAVSAPPVEGRANDAVVELLSDLLGVRRSQVTLVRGASARSKVVEVDGLSAEAAEARLAGHLPKAGPLAEEGGRGGAGGTDDE